MVGRDRAAGHPDGRGEPAPAVEDGKDLDARSQLLLAAHMAGVAMANTGLGICHAIGHSLGGRWNIAHGVTLAMLLPDVLRFNLPVRTERLADIAFALGAGDTRGTPIATPPPPSTPSPRCATGSA